MTSSSSGLPTLSSRGSLGASRRTAHEFGDANRSAHVERRFHHIENNFLAGRTFADWQDLNDQARVWCDTDNAKQRKSLHASPRELFARERVFLNPVPEWTPEIFEIQHRIVDVEGYVSLDTHRYSVPLQIPVGRRLEVRKLKEHVDVYDGPRRVARHRRVLDKSDQRVTNPEHRPRRERREPKGHRERTVILDEVPELASYIDELEKRRESTVRVLRRLLSLVRDYPRDPLVSAVREAQQYGLFDLERVERMIISRLAGDFFRLSDDFRGDPDE